MHDPVFVTMNSRAAKLIIDKLTICALFFFVASQIRQPLITRVKTVGGVPVILDRGWSIEIRN